MAEEIFEVQQGGTALYTATFRDTAGVVIASADVVSITLSLYDKSSGTQINGRAAQDVFGDNNGTYHATSGLFSWEMQALDNIIVSSDIIELRSETHVARLTMVFDTDKVLIHHFPITVIKLQSTVAP